jgi:NAD(P)-dependent dehydrogenase (short-subunit alcohol dehydrogenase family)
MIGHSLLLGTGAAAWGLGAGALALRLVRALRERQRLPMQDRWVVVTGCDSGIGLGVVEGLVARGARVIAFCFTEEGAQRALALGANLAPCLDLTDDDAVQAATRQVMQACEGSLWGVVHNAGVVLPGFVDYLPLHAYRHTMDVNFYAPVLLTQRLLPALRAAKGRVVLVSSVDGLVRRPGNPAYDASKFALEAYADALRIEVSFGSVHVSVVNPATMRTPLASTYFQAHREAWERAQAHDPEGSWRTVWPREWVNAYADFNEPRLARMAQDPVYTVRDILHALTAARPRLRYLSGTLAKTLFYALWVAPEGWSLMFKRGTLQPQPGAKTTS